MMKFTAACVQTNSTDSLEGNIQALAPMVSAAAAQGAQLIALPENAFLMAMGRKFHEQVYSETTCPALKASCEWAGDLGIWLLIGSLAIRQEDRAKGEGDEKSKYLNRSYLIAPTGKIAARYDKIHLFDVSVPGGESHQESKRFAAGNRAVVAPTPLGNIGLSICYDVRFSALYRTMAKADADILTVPAAFTRFTGEKGGWHVLNRARAMETGSFVMAPAQCGSHTGGRQTYGHSLIINPWGDILAEGGEDVGIITAEIDLDQVRATREVMPSLQHDREFEIELIGDS